MVLVPFPPREGGRGVRSLPVPPMTDRPLRVLLAASEVVGFAKTGGLADVAGSLPRALARRGVDVRVVLPLYNAGRQSGRPIEATDVEVHVPVGGQTLAARVWWSKLPDSDVPIYFID